MSESEETPPYSCEAPVLDLAYHPTRPSLLCTGLVNGTLQVFDSGSGAGKLINLHSSCRTLGFDSTGTHLFTGGGEGGVCAVDAAKGTVVWTHRPKSGPGINKVISCEDFGPQVFLSGDEKGVVVLWDIRSKEKTLPDTHADFVADFAYHDRTLLSVSGDGTLGVFDFKRPNKIVRENKSDGMDTELLSVQVMKRGKRVVCGTQEGRMVIFNWGRWERPTDSLRGHPDSVDCLLKLDEDVVLTGSSDGIIRIVRIHPNKLLGVIGYHDDFPVERMVFSIDKRTVATCSHDNLVRFWDTGFLLDGMDQLEEMEFGDVGGAASARASSSEEDEEDDGWVDEDEEMDEDQGEEEKVAPKKKPAAVTRPAKKTKGSSKGGKSSKSFFDEM